MGGEFPFPFFAFMIIISIMVFIVASALATGSWWLIAYALITQGVGFAAFISELKSSNDPKYLGGKLFLSVVGLFPNLALFSLDKTKQFGFFLTGLWLLIDTIPDFFLKFLGLKNDPKDTNIASNFLGVGANSQLPTWGNIR